MLPIIVNLPFNSHADMIPAISWAKTFPFLLLFYTASNENQNFIKLIILKLNLIY